MIALVKYKSIMHKWFYIEDDSYVDVIFGAMFANRIDAHPVWLHIVGPPGCGKTVVLDSLEGHPSVYALGTLTARTLASGKIQDPGEEDPSLLPKLRNKVLVIKDFTAMLTARYEDVVEISGQLRDVFDGSFRAVFGTGKDIRYEVKFGLISAVTEALYDHIKMLAGLGERFLVYQMPRLSEDEVQKRTLVAATSGSENMSVCKHELTVAAFNVLQIQQKPVIVPPDVVRKLTRVARLAARGRTPITRDRYHQFAVRRAFTPEVPTRIVKQLVTLAKGICMARQMKKVDDYVLELVCEVAMGCIPPKRRKTLEMLKKWEGQPVKPTSKMLASLLRLSDMQVRRRMHDLATLELVDEVRAGVGGTGSFVYSLKREWADLI